MFVDAYNKMIVSKDGILKKLESVLNQIVSAKSIEDKIKEVNKNIESVVNDVEILIHSSKEEDMIKHDDLIKELKELEHQKDKVMDKQNKINTFISNLKNKEDAITEFNEELFNIMVDKAIVNRDKSIEFIFNSGYKVKVEARK